MSEPGFLIVVQKIDLATECWIEQHQKLFSDLESVARLTGCDPIELRASYDLEAEDVARLCDHFGFGFDARPGRFEMVVFERNTPFSENSHTGRELLLMLKGEKPLAVFSEPLATAGGESPIPETLFAPYVASGRFVMKIERVSNSRVPVRRVLYALPEEAWRMEAYCMLWRLAEKQGWNPGFEAAEGYLLGYETAIDPFFRAE